MVFLGLYQVPDRALASFPYATMIPAALVLSRLPPGLNIALLVASAAFSIRMNTAVSWLPRIPIALALIAAFTLVAVWLDRRGRVRAEPSAPVASASSRPVAVWASAAFVMALVGAVSLRAWRANAERETLTWPPTSSPVLVEDEGNTLALAASPDGEWVLFVASDGPAGGAPRLWRRGVRSLSATPLAGTEGAAAPFWSPDGHRVGFFADGRLKTLDLSSGAVTVLASAPMGRGGAWSPRGVIVFASDLTGGLSRVKATGGSVTTATAIDRARGERSHRWPSFLPDGRHFVFASRAARREQAVVALGELDSGAVETIVAVDASPAYAGPGFLLLGSVDGLWMQPFDLSRLRAFGARYRLGASAYSAATGRGAFAATDRVVVFAGPTVDQPAETPSHLRWVDDHGRPLTAATAADAAAQIALSHDDTATGIDRGAGEGIVTSRSPDGRAVLYQQRRPKAPGAWNVWIQPRDRGADAVRLVDDRHNAVQAQFSPDGRWIAYTSDEDGADEVYVQPYPQTGERWQVSMDGGAQPRWRSDRELVYVAADQFVRTAAIDTRQTFRSGPPRPLFELPLRPVDRRTRLFEFAIASDGSRFLVNAVDAWPQPAPVTMVFGWRSAPVRQ